MIYVGKAKSLRHRVRSYFSEDKLADVKTGTLIAEARDIDYILVDNEKEALALENNLIKQYKPRFNILLRDDKTYPYIKLTHEKISAGLRHAPPAQGRRHLFRPVLPGQPGAPPGALHPPPFSGAFLQGGPDALSPQAVPAIPHSPLPGAVRGGLTTDEAYAAAVRDVRLFLEGRHSDLARDLRARMEAASEEMRFEEAAVAARPAGHRGRDRRAAEDGGGQGRRRRYFRAATPSRRWWRSTCSTCATARSWTGASSSGKTRRSSTSRSSFRSLLKQIYLDQQFIPAEIHVPVEFEDREALEELLTEKRQRQGGDPHAAARAEEGAAGPGGDQREAQLRRALPRAEAVLARHPGGLAGRAEPAGGAGAHRVLRHLAHPGHRQSGQHGGVGRRPDEEGRLPQVHHQDGDRQRRFRQHAGSGDAALRAPAAREARRCPGWC